jgi:HAD superfamily hydrolase (TIGR01484 family)
MINTSVSKKSPDDKPEMYQDQPDTHDPYLHERPLPLSALTGKDAEQVSFFLTDVDDTVTTGGRLLPAALESLWKLHEAGIRVILVTGGSAGWADTYFRQWPVDAVITESGAIAWYRDEQGKRCRIDHPAIEQKDYRRRADRLIERVLTEVPGSKLSVDQFCRIYDIAFDHHEEEPWLDETGIEAIKSICLEEGASFGVSSIHVNCWFGDYTKLSMVQYFLETVYGMTFDDMLVRSVYCGDAPNDAPLFSFFPLSFGVANVLSHADSISCLPAYVSSEIGGQGFSLIVDAVLGGRKPVKRIL